MTAFSNYNLIVDLIPKESTVLDLGCGSGELMTLLKQKGCSVHGVEIDQSCVVSCIEKGLSVIQGDLDKGLTDYGNQSYDYVVISKTIQTLKSPNLAISEVLRVGKKAIVSFPNFGHYKLRFGLFLIGKMPKNKALPYEWYNTPNIRLLTIKDFYDFARLLQFNIEQKVVLNKGKIRNGLFDNLFAEEALFVLNKKST